MNFKFIIKGVAANDSKLVNSKMFSLSDKQSIILKAALNGHNVFITGQGGSGKSYLAKEIFRKATEAGRKVAIVCSTGIACKAYADLYPINPARTVHSFYGFGAADLHWPSIVDRSLSDNLVRERVKAHDCIIWDEISMISRRIFEIANVIHHKLANESDACIETNGGKTDHHSGRFSSVTTCPKPI